METGAEVTALVYSSETPSARATLIVAHGAGAGQHSPFIVSFAHGLSGRGLDVVTFNFPYTEQHRRVPDRRPVLDACYVAVIHSVHQHFGSARAALFIGGKSMGGRIATHVAAADPALPVAGLVLLGYPLHPPGKPTERRDAHLRDIRRPVLIVQADAFNRSRLQTTIAVVLTSNLRLIDAPGNVLVPKQSSGLPKDSVANVSQLVTLDRDFLTERAGKVTPRLLAAVDACLKLVLARR